MNPIVFPGLGLELNISRVAFTVLGRSVYWYGVIIALGMALGVTYAYRSAKQFGIKKDSVLDMILFAAPGGIIGARIYYVFFYQSIYRNTDGSMNWGNAVAIWDGGLAIYGGIIAALLILFVFCRINTIKFFAFADLGVYVLFSGQAIGRWGNFCNQEAYGSVTTLPWRMGLTVNNVYKEVHPTFLYESLWNLLGFAIAHFLLKKKRKFDGEIFLFYLAWYGLGRMWIEGLRTDSLYLFSSDIRVSQLLATLCFVCAGAVLVYLLINVRRNPATLYVNQSSENEDIPTLSSEEENACVSLSEDDTEPAAASDTLTQDDDTPIGEEPPCETENTTDNEAEPTSPAETEEN